MARLSLVLALVFSVQAHAQSAPTLDRMALLIERGHARRAAGDVIGALGLYRDAISVAPRRSAGYVALGELYLALSEPSRALEVFESGARAAGDGEALWIGLARARDAMGKHDEARDALRTLRVRAPDAPAALSALAEAAEARGAFVEALSVRRALLARLDADAPAYTEARARVRALERLVGAADRVRGGAVCKDPRVGAVRHALAGCP